MQIVGKADAGQIARVAALFVHLAQLIGVAAPQGDPVTGARELHRERGAPGTGPENGDVRIVSSGSHTGGCHGQFWLAWVAAASWLACANSPAKSMG